MSRIRRILQVFIGRGRLPLYGSLGHRWDSFGTVDLKCRKPQVTGALGFSTYRRESEKNGEGGIRTPGAVACTLVFETSSISHSDTSPGSRRGGGHRSPTAAVPVSPAAGGQVKAIGPADDRPGRRPGPNGES